MIASLIVYILIGIFALFFSSLKQTKRCKIIFLILCGVVLVTQMALRDMTEYQLDWTNYYTSFFQVSKLSWKGIFTNYDYEYGYWILNWLTYKVFGSWLAFVIISYSLIYIFTFRFIYKYSRNIYVSTILFITLGFYGSSYVLIRQIIAISICLWAYDYIKTKKLIPFVLVVLLAFSFHKSALIFLPLFFVGNIKLNTINIVIVFIACLIMMYFATDIMGAFNDVFDRSYGKEEITSYTGRIINLIIYALLLVLGYIAFNNNGEVSSSLKRDCNIELYSIILGIAIYLLQFFEVGISHRLVMYFTSSMMYVTVANISGVYESKRDRIVINTSFIVFSTLLFFIGTYRNNLYDYAYILEGLL